MKNQPKLLVYGKLKEIILFPSMIFKWRLQNNLVKNSYIRKNFDTCLDK